MGIDCKSQKTGYLDESMKFRYKNRTLYYAVWQCD